MSFAWWTLTSVLLNGAFYHVVLCLCISTFKALGVMYPGIMVINRTGLNEMSVSVFIHDNTGLNIFSARDYQFQW